MKTIAMCFSLIQLPRCKVHLLANPWWGNFYKLGRSSVASSPDRHYCSKPFELEGGQRKKWTRRTITTETGENNEKLKSKTSRSSVASSPDRHYCSKPFELEGGQRKKWTRRTITTETGENNEKLKSKTSKPNTCQLESTEIEKSRTVSIKKKIVSENSSVKLTSSKLETSEVGSDQYYADLAKCATILCFDIETTGFSRENDRIIEIGVQDLRGGENSTFQALVNPGCKVPNEHIHGISTRMVNRPDVPRMKELIPIFLQYVRSRQIPGGIVVLVSHNGRTFDVPFLKREFIRWSYEIPSDWYFADTVPLARQVIKLKGTKVPSRISLQALREHYDIPLIGSAHRALSDVHTLALVLQRLTYDLKLPISGLIKESFKQ